MLRISAWSRASSAAGSRNNSGRCRSSTSFGEVSPRQSKGSRQSRPSGSSTVQFAFPLIRIRECPIARPFTRVEDVSFHRNDDHQSPG
jgi:hypothetical protein